MRSNKNETISVAELTATCPVCASLACKTKTKWYYKQWEIKECSCCGLQFAWPIKAGNIDYYQGYETYRKMRSNAEENNIHPGTLRISNKISYAINKYVMKSSSRIDVLDYGCGSGYFSACCYRQGCRVTCVDFNPEMVAIAKEVYGLEAYVKTSGDLLKDNTKFDVILLNHVLEHLSDPIGILQELYRLLNENGIIFVSLPNREYIRERKHLIKGKLLDGLYPPHHVTFWTSRSLSSALSTAGFKVLECRPEEYPLQDTAETSLIKRFGDLAGFSGLVAKTCVVFGRALKLSGPNLIAIGSA